MALSLLSSSRGRRVWFLGERCSVFDDKTEEEEEDKRKRERKRKLEKQGRKEMIISKKKLPFILLLLPRLLSLVSSGNSSVSVCLIVLHRSKRRHLMPFLGFLNTNSPPIKTQRRFLDIKELRKYTKEDKTP